MVGMSLSQAVELFGFETREPITATMITSRFRKLAKKAHPDVAGTDCALRFIDLHNAYNVLKDEVAISGVILNTLALRGNIRHCKDNILVVVKS